MTFGEKGGWEGGLGGYGTSSSTATTYLYSQSRGKLWDELSTARFLHIVRLLLRLRLALKGALISLLTTIVVPMG